MDRLEIIVLAAGAGTRMRSDRPKVLHALAGRPLLAHVLATAAELRPAAIHVVYGHGGEQVRAAFPGLPVHWVEQAERLGTGHAVAQALPAVADDALVLVLYGDVPLTTAATLHGLIAAAGPETPALLTAVLPDPTGYGRIVRNAAGQAVRIVEQKDANADELALNEVNTGMMALPAAPLKAWVGRLRNDNAQGEYYLTDVVAAAVADGMAVVPVVARALDEVLGVNDRLQLAHLERAYQRRQAEALMRAGVALADPARFDLRGELVCGRDVFIDVGAVFEGRVVLGDNVTVGAHCVVRDSTLAEGAEILPMSLIESAEIGPDCHVGPFARIRPGTRLAEGARIGNFVEVKKSAIGRGSKVNHLSYVGDATVGANVNIGAGTITCNYDGANKHQTVIGDGAFIGSDTQLVAPVEVGAGATIGAGSTITRDTPAGELTLSRAKQQTLPGWKRPVKKR
jgi:bifunctional UDP-N-acetylglucosamine pyrophosphorylase/glucosamine-1-phosphate N-acetyltransferase